MRFTTVGCNEFHRWRIDVWRSEAAHHTVLRELAKWRGSSTNGGNTAAANTAVLHTPKLPNGAAVASKYAFITMNAPVAIARISVECGAVVGSRERRAIESGGRLTSITSANDSCCYGLKSVPRSGDKAGACRCRRRALRFGRSRVWCNGMCPCRAFHLSLTFESFLLRTTGLLFS